MYRVPGVPARLAGRLSAAPFPRLLASLFLTLLLLLSALLAGRQASASPVRVDAVEAELVADRAAVAPGEPLRLGLRLAHDPHWHTYWRNPGDSGLPTQFEPELPEGFRIGPIEWPAPTRMLIPPLANYGYEGEVVLPRHVEVPDRIEGDTVGFRVVASWLVCRDVCIPGEATLELVLPVARGGSAGPGPHHALFERAQARSPGAAVAADYRLDDDGMLSILVPAEAGGADAAIEFFPHVEGAVAAAAPQRLYRLDDGRRRLEVALTDEWRALSPAERKVPVDGVLVSADGAKPLAIVAGEPVAPGGGELAAIAEGIVVQLGTAGSTSLLGARLRDAAGFASRPAPATAAGGVGSSAAVASSTLGFALGFAFIGGLILNLMPCVFPVIGLKILGFAGQGAGGASLDAAARQRVRRGATWFALGVVVSFWVLAALLLALRASGAAIGWGFQLQSPVFVAAMGLLFVAIGLNLSGLYELGAVLTRVGAADRIDDRHPAWSAFASGGLAVLVATPCTAPFMGPALGYTLTQPAPVSLAVFTALGLGMAAPYILLGCFPAWLRLLPRPGRWMESLRQMLAFPMYAAAAWLAWVLGRQSGVDAVFGFAIAAILIAAGLWAWGRFVQRGVRAGSRRVAAFVAIACVGGALALAWQGANRADATPAADAAGLEWRAWSNATLDASLAAGEPVFVDFTAAWCVSCQANKLLVLDTDAVRAAFDARGVVMLRADWTRQDPAITAELARHGRNGVPLYLLYDGRGGEPQVLPELLSTGIVLAALERIPRR
ncbi:MAG: thioredoxin family protein [Burkholderiaceae bacterium]|nr:thioredoxin family protein [Burkholderiaceae bacterium]